MLSSKILTITQAAVQLHAAHRPTDPTAKLQQLLDLSTFDCNKPIIIEMLRLVANRDDINWERLKTDSHHGSTIVFEPGTFVRINDQHDQHNYDSGSFALICSAQAHLRHRRMKTFMQALRPDGTIGNNLYLYNPYYPQFEPWPIPEAIETFLSGLPRTLQVSALLQTLEAI